MKALLIGIELDEAQTQSLRDAGIEEFESREKPPTKARKKNTRLVLYAPKAQPTEEEVAKFPELFPKAWVVLVGKTSWVEKEGFSDVLKTFNDVWYKDLLPGSFAIGLQTWKQVLDHKNAISELKAEIKHLKNDCASLTEQSTKLVEQLERDIALATTIQRSLIPRSSPVIPGVHFQTKYLPSGGKGGDYFDIFEFGDRKRFGVLVADSKSHGMAAALLSVLIKLRLEELKERFTDSKSFVEHLNNEIQLIHSKDLSEMSLLYGIFDRASLSFQYTVAGSLRTLLWRLGEASPLVTSANPPVGKVDKFEYKESFLTLKPGDLLVLSTDGLETPLLHGSPEVPFTEKMAELLKKHDPNPDPLDLQNEVMAQVDRYAEQIPLPDDITLLQISIEETAMYIAKK